jgi:hypothetical protein
MSGSQQHSDDPDSDHPKSWRVKLYQLDESDAWVDRGTGNVHCCENDASCERTLLLIDEVDQSVILSAQLEHECLFERQNGTLPMLGCT